MVDHAEAKLDEGEGADEESDDLVCRVYVAGLQRLAVIGDEGGRELA